MSEQQIYEARAKRMRDAIALQEPDFIPVMPNVQCFPYFHAGYTMADILYDTDMVKAKDAIFRYLDEFQPDALFGHSYVNIGQGPIMELGAPKTMRWAGMPGQIVEDDSIHQFIEFPILEDDEFEEFTRDPSAWTLHKGMPRSAAVFEPLASFDPYGIGVYSNYVPAAAVFSSPAFKKMIETLWKIHDLSEEMSAKSRKLDQEIEEHGFLIPATGFAMVPFDNYSDFYRGTLNASYDLYEHPEVIREYCERQLESTLQSIRFQAQVMPGKMVFMPLHKGMEGFMSDAHYREFYWSHLQTIINTIIDVGMVPFIYTEGKYDSRLECLKEVPRGKVFYSFEDIDFARAKQVLGDTACIMGGVSSFLLSYGTKEQVIDETKRIIDICAPGGGFILSSNMGLDYAKPENLAAMIETARSYGKK
ncbi:MAG: hypothetical protein IJJ50_00805 [Lachnospiraceae bacterium]|nr:hypothetical protein [Lachnospiraceae bacterium]